MELIWKFGGKIFSVVFKVVKKPSLKTIGITNETKDGYFLPFIDYDDIEYMRVIRDIKHLQNVFGLGSCIILRTSKRILHNKEVGNYLVCFFDKMPYWDIYEILRHCSCDKRYRYYAMNTVQKNWVVRIAPKVHMRTMKEIKPAPVFRAFIKCRGRHPVSQAHKSFFEWKFCGKDIKQKGDVELICYETCE